MSIMENLQDLGVINGLRVIELTYPIEWKTAYSDGTLVREWREKHAGVFEEFDSGMSGSSDLFAQSCAMYLLWLQGYRSTTFYKLAHDSARSKGKHSTPAALAARQGFIFDRLGEDRCKTFRQRLIDQRLTHIIGEPDLFCWRPDGPEWFFAEAKDEATNDGLRFSQIQWMFAAKETFGDDVQFRLYVLRPAPISR
jgi:hypothetical protein